MKGIFNMSVALIDRTLSYMTINQKFADKEALMAYINGVFSCGADYVEINSSLLPLLEGEDLSEKYILQICSVKDIKLCVDQRFAYVSIPASLSVFFEKLADIRHIGLYNFFCGAKHTAIKTFVLEIDSFSGKNAFRQSNNSLNIRFVQRKYVIRPIPT